MYVGFDATHLNHQQDDHKGKELDDERDADTVVCGDPVDRGARARKDEQQDVDDLEPGGEVRKHALLVLRVHELLPEIPTGFGGNVPGRQAATRGEGGGRGVKRTAPACALNFGQSFLQKQTCVPMVTSTVTC